MSRDSGAIFNKDNIGSELNNVISELAQVSLDWVNNALLDKGVEGKGGEEEEDTCEVDFDHGIDLVVRMNQALAILM